MGGLREDTTPSVLAEKPLSISSAHLDCIMQIAISFSFHHPRKQKGKKKNTKCILEVRAQQPPKFERDQSGTHWMMCLHPTTEQWVMQMPFFEVVLRYFVIISSSSRRVFTPKLVPNGSSTCQNTKGIVQNCSQRAESTTQNSPGLNLRGHDTSTGVGRDLLLF